MMSKTFSFEPIVWLPLSTQTLHHEQAPFEMEREGEGSVAPPARTDLACRLPLIFRAASCKRRRPSCSGSRPHCSAGKSGLVSTVQPCCVSRVPTRRCQAAELRPLGQRGEK